MTEPFDEGLQAFLRWQAADTAGAPTPDAMAVRIVERQPRTAVARHRLALVFATVMVVSAAAIAGAAFLGSRPPTIPRVLSNGGVVTFDGACGLVAQAVGTGRQQRFLGDVAGCPSGSRASDGAFAALYYPAITSSADGRVVVATRQVFCGGCGGVPTPEALAAQGVYLVDMATGDARRLDACETVRCGFYAAVSPDGRHVAFSTWPYAAVAPGTSTPGVVTIVDLEHDTMTTLDDDGVGGLRFSDDGRRLAITSIDASPDYSVVSTTVEVVDVDGGGRRTIATLDGSGTLAWSADGQTLRVAIGKPGDDETGRLTTQTIDVDTGVVVAGPTVDADPETATWSQDGQSLAYVVSHADGSGGRLMVIDTDGASPRLVSGGTLDDHVSGAPVWSPDGHLIAVGGEARVDGVARSGTFVVGVDDGSMTWLGPDAGVLAWLPADPTRPSPSSSPAAP